MVPTVLYCAGIVCRAKLTDVGAASTRRLPATQKGELPSGAAGTEATPSTSSAASATVLEDIIDPMDMDSGADCK